MSVHDRLDEVESRLASPMTTYKENATEDAPALLVALRAVLDIHEMDGDYCIECQERFDGTTCPTVSAIEHAMGGES